VATLKFSSESSSRFGETAGAERAVSKSNPKPRHVWLFRLGILAYSIHKRSDRLVVKNQASEIMAAWGEDVAWGEAWELL
jgi:hypothetical protein